MGIGDDLNLILNRNLIFPEDQLKMINLIKNRDLIKTIDGSIALRTIEDRNLIFPDDIMQLRGIISRINAEPTLKTFVGLTVSTLEEQPVVSSTIEIPPEPVVPKQEPRTVEVLKTEDISTKRASEVSRPPHKDGYLDDPVEYNRPKYIIEPSIFEKSGGKKNVTIYAKKNDYKKVYSDYLNNTSYGILHAICTAAQFKKNNPSGYAYRLYFDGYNLKITNDKYTEIKEIPIKASEETTPYSKFYDKHNVCINDKLKDWNSLFLSKNKSEVFQRLLKELNSMDFVELVRVDDAVQYYAEEFDDAVRSYHSYSDMIERPRMSVTHYEKGHKTPAMTNFYNYLIGGSSLYNYLIGGNSSTSYDEYRDAKSNYIYHRDMVIHRLLNGNL